MYQTKPQPPPIFIPLSILWLITETLISGAVFMTLWNWFATQPPIDLPPLAWPLATALTYVISFAVNQGASGLWVLRGADPVDVMKNSVHYKIGLWSLSLMAGYIIKNWWM